MFWKERMMNERILMTLGLFLIGSLHTMIFSFFEFPTNFLLGNHFETYSLASKLLLYSCAIGVSFAHQTICRNIGLKRALSWGLVCNLLGLITLWLNATVGGSLALLFLDMIFFGAALTSVVNALVTYVVLTFPNHTGAGIVALFAFFNGGVMLSPLVIALFSSWQISSWLYPVLIGLLLLAMFYVARSFFDPPYPTHVTHLRKGSLLWKELHYRLGLFLTAIICYGLAENTLNLWGFFQIKTYLGDIVASETVSLFWLFLIIGQLTLLIPLYFLSPKRIFYCLIPIIVIDLYFFAHQTTLSGFITALIIGGFGCSAVFPILISLMEKELARFASGSELVPYIETSISVLVAGYFLGVGGIDVWIEWAKGPLFSIPVHFYLGMIFISYTGICTLYLNLTSKKV